MQAASDAGDHHFYIMELQPGLFIDARKKGNLARLLNSCCDPNCETQKWYDAATGEVSWEGGEMGYQSEGQRGGISLHFRVLRVGRGARWGIRVKGREVEYFCISGS
jgi:hypothetical protein